VISEWNIQARSHVCQQCGRRFEPREGYHTFLREEKLGYVRQDVCENCWAGSGATSSPDGGFLSHWRGVHEVPTPVPEPIKKDTAESLLRKLSERDDPRFEPARFILAVMLERKRALKVRAQAVQDGRRVLVYEHPKSGDVLTVVDPNLQLDQLEEVQRMVAHLLEHGLEADLPPATSAPAAADSREGLGEAMAGSPALSAEPGPARTP
jgi:hypothetical protein